MFGAGGRLERGAKFVFQCARTVRHPPRARHAVGVGDHDSVLQPEPSQPLDEGGGAEHRDRVARTGLARDALEGAVARFLEAEDVDGGM